MSASIAIASGAAAQSAIAAQQAHQAKVISCQSFVSGYKHDTATQQEMKQYAECTQLLLPSEPMPDGAAIILKACIVFLLVAFVVGCIKVDLWSEDPVGRFMNGLMWAGIAFVFLLVSGLIIAAVCFLFS